MLMDVMMPVMDGLTATRAIRELGDAHSEIPIFAMTTNVFQDDVQRCIDTGMNEHLSKPLKVSELRLAIARHVKKCR